jgi:hypothetical protein
MELVPAKEIRLIRPECSQGIWIALARLTAL